MTIFFTMQKQQYKIRFINALGMLKKMKTFKELIYHLTIIEYFLTEK